jgi:hypothetical protein
MELSSGGKVPSSGANLKEECFEWFYHLQFKSADEREKHVFSELAKRG